MQKTLRKMKSMRQIKDGGKRRNKEESDVDAKQKLIENGKVLKLYCNV